MSMLVSSRGAMISVRKPEAVMERALKVKKQLCVVRERVSATRTDSR